VLLSDKISAFRKFESSHKGLSEAAKTGKDPALETIAGTVKSFELNRMIHEELDHYEEFGEVLGKHPKLRKIKLAQDISKLTEAKALKRRNNLRTYISRDSKKLKKMKAGAAKDKFSGRLDDFKTELELLEKRFKFE